MVFVFFLHWLLSQDTSCAHFSKDFKMEFMFKAIPEGTRLTAGKETDTAEHRDDDLELDEPDDE